MADEPWKAYQAAKPPTSEDGPWSEYQLARPTQAAPAPTSLERPASSLVRRVVGDTAVDLGKGILGVGEAAVGLADIPSGGMVGKALETVGYRPQEAKDFLGEFYSPERQEANQAVNDAQGFIGTTKAMLQNPSTIIGSAVESAPSMLAGGAIGKGVGLVTGLARPALLAGIGEGAVGAGSAAEQMRQQSADGALTAQQVGASVASGVGTGLLGVAGGKIAQKLGIADVDTALVGGVTVEQPATNVVKRAVQGAVAEGVLEEAPQSAQEQAWQNLATGKPLSEGVAEATAQGVLTGGLVGGGVSALVRPDAGPISRAASKAPAQPYPNAQPGTMAGAANAIAQTQPVAVSEPTLTDAIQRENQRKKAKKTPETQANPVNTQPEADMQPVPMQMAPTQPAPGAIIADENKTFAIPPANMDPATGELLPAQDQPTIAAHLANQGRINGRVPGVSDIVRAFNVHPDKARQYRKDALALLAAQSTPPTTQAPETGDGQGNLGDAAGSAVSGIGEDGAGPTAGDQPTPVVAADENPVPRAEDHPRNRDDSREPLALAGEAAVDQAQPETGVAPTTATVEGTAPTYDESDEQQEGDVTPPSGNPYSIRDAAEKEAARRPNARVFEVEGGFVVREPRQAPAAPTAAQDRLEKRPPAQATSPASVVASESSQPVTEASPPEAIGGSTQSEAGGAGAASSFTPSAQSVKADLTSGKEGAQGPSVGDEAMETRTNIVQVGRPTSVGNVTVQARTLDGPKAVRAKSYEMPGYSGPQLAVATYKLRGKEGYRVYLPKSGTLLQDSNGVSTLEDTLKQAVQRVQVLRSRSQQAAPSVAPSAEEAQGPSVVSTADHAAALAQAKSAVERQLGRLKGDELQKKVKGILSVFGQKPARSRAKDVAAVLATMDQNPHTALYDLDLMHGLPASVRGPLTAKMERRVSDEARTTEQPAAPGQAEPAATKSDGERYDAKIAELNDRAKRFGKDSTIERARSAVAGNFIGRDFGESAESFYARDPAARATRDWLAAQDGRGAIEAPSKQAEPAKGADASVRVARAQTADSYKLRIAQFAEPGTVGGWRVLRVPSLEQAGVTDFQLANSWNLVSGFASAAEARAWGRENKANPKGYIAERAKETPETQARPADVQANRAEPMGFMAAEREAKRLTAETGTKHVAVQRDTKDADGMTVGGWFAEPEAAKSDKPAPGRFVQPKGNGSREQQMELASRGSTIAAIKALNAMAAKNDPDAAYSDDEIENATNFDAMRDYLSRKAVVTPTAGDKAEPRKVASQPTSVDYKGFDRVEQDGGAFYLRDGAVVVRVEPTEKGKFQASSGSAKSSPHLRGEQEAVEWAAVLRESAKKAKAARRLPDPPTFEYRLMKRGGSTYLIPPVGKSFDNGAGAALQTWLRDAGYFVSMIGPNEISVGETSNSPPLDHIEDGVKSQRLAREVEKAGQPTKEKGKAETTPERTGKDSLQVARDAARARPFDDFKVVREEARKAVIAAHGEAAAEEMTSGGGFFRSDELTNAVHDGQYEAIRDFAGTMPVPVHESDVSGAAERAFHGTSHSPEQRAEGATRSYVRVMVDAWRQGEAAAKDDPEALARVTEEMGKLKRGYVERYRGYLSSHANVMSTNIAGPARFPVARNQKRMDAADRKASEANDFLKKGVARMLKAAKAPVDNSPDSELARVRANLAEREAQQERMKATNAALRKGDDAALRKLGYDDAEIARLKKPDFAGRVGAPDYALKNNNAEIRRLRERLAAVEQRAAAAIAGPTQSEFNGVRIEENATDNRVRLFFDGKPTEPVREALRRSGWKWSPKAGAWQRQLTENARRNAAEILAKHFPTKKQEPEALARLAERRTDDRSTFDVDKVVGSITKKWVNAPNVQVVDSVFDMPADLVREFERYGNAAETVHGAYHTRSETIFLVRNNMASRADLERTLFHEAYGHHGLRLMFGNDMDRQVQRLLNAIGGVGGIRAYAKRHNIDLSFYDALDKTNDRTFAEHTLFDELFAHMAERINTLPKNLAQKVKEFIGAVRAWLRQHGFTTLAGSLSDGEVAHLLQRSRKAVEGNERAMAPEMAAAARFQMVYHGTPARGIDRFSSEFMGTGEGAQAYGWGHYFASRRELADFYREKLSAPTMTNDILARYFTPGGRVKGYGGTDEVVRFVPGPPEREWDWHVVVREVRRDGTLDPERWHRTTPDVKEVERVLGEKVPRGQLYQVEVPENDELLDWDKPLAEQPRKVRDALAGVFPTEGFSNPTGQIIYMNLRNRAESGKEYGFGGVFDAVPGAANKRPDQIASEYLRSLGIPGLRYLDGASRKAGEGHHNYVIWNEDAITDVKPTLFRFDDDDDFGLIENNGSGDSSASIEAINRRLEDKSRGQVRVLIERDGSVRALLGVDAVDTHARAGQIIVQRGVGREEWTVLSQGNDVSRDLAQGRLNAARGKITELLRGDEPLFSFGDARAPQKQTDTPAFRKWFGDSNVVDESGAPMLLYHGTTADFDSFDLDFAGADGVAYSRPAVFATPDAFLASQYAENKNDRDVGDAFRRLEKGKAQRRAAGKAAHSGRDYEADQDFVSKKLKEQDARGGNRAMGANVMPVYMRGNMAKFDAQGRNFMEVMPDAIKYADEGGFDGVIVKNVVDSASAASRYPSTVVASFHRGNVKSASGNSGAFDASNPDIRFSMRTPSEAMDDIESLMNAGEDRSVVQKAKDKLADLTPAKVKDALRGTWLGALTTNHLTELGSDYFDNIKHYSDFLGEMNADRNQLQQEGEEQAEPWRQWASKHPAEQKELAGVMHDATIDGVDPSKAYQPLQFRYSNKLWDATPKNIKEAIKAITQQMRERSGDSKANMLDEIKALRAMRNAETRRKGQYPALVQRYATMSDEAKGFFAQVRDAYLARSQMVEDGLVARIEDTDAPEHQKRKLITTIRQQFETHRLQGIYFPLQRHGQYFVSAEKGDTTTFLMTESLSDLERKVKGLREKGWTIKAQGLKSQGKAAEAPSGTFVADVITQLQKAGVSDKTQDDIYQMYLESLPELSMRKHAIHRKNVPGFDPDAIRAFAFNMHHGAHQIARLRYAHKLADTITLLKQQQDAKRKEDGADTRRIAAGDAILGELDKRHAWINNPTDSKATGLVSSFGFVYYLGLTPAAALVNLSQTALVTFPHLAAKYGPVKAMNALLSAMADSAATLGHAQKKLTDADEIKAHAELQRMGALDKTQAHNLAGIAEGGMAGYNPAWAKAMKIIGWGFHKTEVVNREATGLAAYRLARQAGEDHEQAVKSAARAITDTHFDYTNQNRARFMQSGTAKVLLMFRQYSLNMTWHLGRMVWQATKGQDAETRKIARRNLAGILGMSALFSGTLGLPLMSVTFGVLNALAASFGDDDEPWDAETEFRAFLNDMLGDTAGDIAATGGVNAITGADIASRVSLSQLWFRDADRELDGRGAYFNLLEQAAGPMGGVLKNALVGKQLIDDGHVQRGIETMLPKALKDTLKAQRYAAEGVDNLRGDPLVDDLPLKDTLLQLAGFTPDKVAAQYDKNRSLKNYEQAILDRRQALTDAFALAVRADDAEGRDEAIAKIKAFNAKYPEIAITMKGLRQSVARRARYSQDAEHGIVLNKKLAARVRAEVGD